MPRPSTTCQVAPRGPVQPGLSASMAAAATDPSTRGAPNARPAVIVVSPRRAQAWPRSSSSPATQTNSMTAHPATPFSWPITAGVKIVA